MEFILFRFFALLSVAFVASHAAISTKDYWRSVLPNTPMPKSISTILPSSFVKSGNKGKPVKVGINKNKWAAYADSADLHVYDDTTTSLFFLEKDLHEETNMNIHFSKTTTPTPFLPRNVADSIPFSSKKLPEILTKFSIKENTLESKAMKKTIDDCEAPGNNGEEKYCATSLENMIDFTTSKLGTKVNAVSTDVKEESYKMQKYKVVGLKLLAKQAIVCHKENYAYAVFYCHKTKVKPYTVLLVGNDGTKAKAAAICHPDTASWNPKHLAFQVLNVKPGTVSVCHILPEDHVLWVPY